MRTCQTILSAAFNVTAGITVCATICWSVMIFTLAKLNRTIPLQQNSMWNPQNVSKLFTSSQSNRDWTDSKYIIVLHVTPFRLNIYLLVIEFRSPRVQFPFPFCAVIGNGIRCRPADKRSGRDEVLHFPSIAVNVIPFKSNSYIASYQYEIMWIPFELFFQKVVLSIFFHVNIYRIFLQQRSFCALTEGDKKAKYM